ncbi:hypothetical protein QLG10_00920 [Pseudomonas sp. V98_8]|uniref:hypothetical protein n=1 Tax=Pseudomonas sp. V98_8 TaxID=3044228 RepID=UPI00249F2D53|nr:hypothetical protein [Pseudomonas sp. V98_8]MDI3390986.1 hypothetical protein [Pseudomonas sp. V98_8]
MTSVYELLEDKGPCLSSDLVAAMVNEEGITHVAARKRVSRADERIGRVYNLFPRNTVFLYIKEYFGSDEYWLKLTGALLQANAAYGKALAALIERGGIVAEPFFHIACGAPLRLKKHVSSTTMVDQLLRAQLVERQYVPSSGNCIALAKGPGMYDGAVAALRARTAAEDIFLAGFETWCKNLGLVSFEKVKLRHLEEKDQPQVGTFCWDLTAPSYLSGISQIKADGMQKPGFLLADILFDVEVSESGLLAFITKVETVKNLKNVGACICFFIAESYSNDAFNLLKRKGIIPATPTSLFGKDVASALRLLMQTLTEAGQKAIDADTLEKLFVGLKKFEGATGNLRGTLFEYFVADVVGRTRNSYRVRLNEKIRNQGGQESETDVLVEAHGLKTYFIECKGYAPYALISEDEITRWLTIRIPNTYKYCLTHPDWKNTSIHFELWTTGKISEKSRLEIEKISGAVKKYTVSVKFVNDIQAEVKSTGEKKLQHIFNQYFVSHPLRQAGRVQVSGPKNLSKLPVII